MILASAVGSARADGDTTAEPTPRSLHIEVRGVGSRSSVARVLAPPLRQLITDDMTQTPVPVFAGAPPQGYALDVAITRLWRSTSDGFVEVSCEVTLVLEQLPSHAMVMMTSSGATAQAPRASFRPEQERALQVQALEGAVHDADHTVLSYLASKR